MTAMGALRAPKPPRLWGVTSLSQLASLPCYRAGASKAAALLCQLQWTNTNRLHAGLQLVYFCCTYPADWGPCEPLNPRLEGKTITPTLPLARGVHRLVWRRSLS